MYLPGLIFALLKKLYANFLAFVGQAGSEFSELRSGDARILARLDEMERSNSLAFEAIEQEHREQQADISKILAALQPLPAVSILFDVQVEGQPIIEGVQQMRMSDTQQATISLRPVDKVKNPAPVQDGSVVWDGSEVSAFATVTPSADGLSAVVSSNGPLGTGQLRVSADADLGDGVVTISDAIQIEVVAGQAVGLGLSASDPIEQPA